MMHEGKISGWWRQDGGVFLFFSPLLQSNRTLPALTRRSNTTNIFVSRHHAHTNAGKFQNASFSLQFGLRSALPTSRCLLFLGNIRHISACAAKNLQNTNDCQMFAAVGEFFMHLSPSGPFVRLLL